MNKKHACQGKRVTEQLSNLAGGRTRLVRVGLADDGGKRTLPVQWIERWRKQEGLRLSVLLL